MLGHLGVSFASWQKVPQEERKSLRTRATRMHRELNSLLKNVIPLWVEGVRYSSALRYIHTGQSSQAWPFHGQWSAQPIDRGLWPRFSYSRDHMTPTWKGTGRELLGFAPLQPRTQDSCFTLQHVHQIISAVVCLYETNQVGFGSQWEKKRDSKW